MNFNNLVNFSQQKAASSIGIIGGADGPTAIYIASRPIEWIGIAVAVFAAIACVVIVVKKWKKK